MNTCIETEASCIPTRERLPAKKSRAGRKQFREHSPLAYECHAMGIPSFNPESVDRWKDARLHELRYPKRQEIDVSTMVYCAFCLVILICINRFAFQIGMGWGMITLLTSIVTGSCCLAWFSTETEIASPRPLARWKTTSWENFLNMASLADLAIPESVRNTAEELKARLPNATLEVDYLDKDPFLRACHVSPNGREESAIVCFWNEHGFVG